MTFLEAPQSEEEMRRYCKEVDGPKLANMLEGGLTPILSPTQLKEIGYTGTHILYTSVCLCLCVCVCL